MGDVIRLGPAPGRLHRNGHLLELDGCEWRCLHCRHWFDAAVDADAFWCGDPCQHPAPDAVLSGEATDGTTPTKEA